MPNDPMEAAALLPCPFCGSTDLEEGGNHVTCGECEASAYVEEWDSTDNGREAIARWNRRAPAALPADVAGLCERLKAQHDRLNAMAEWPAGFKSDATKAAEIDEAMSMCWQAATALAAMQARVGELEEQNDTLREDLNSALEPRGYQYLMQRWQTATRERDAARAEAAGYLGAMDAIRSDIVMLSIAVNEGDPRREIVVRVQDIKDRIDAALLTPEPAGCTCPDGESRSFHDSCPVHDEPHPRNIDDMEAGVRPVWDALWFGWELTRSSLAIFV